jgi:hypothetical protein
VTDFETKQHKADITTGELLYNLQVVALNDRGAEVIQVKVASDPKVGQSAMPQRDITARPRSNGSERLGCGLVRACIGRKAVVRPDARLAPAFNGSGHTRPVGAQCREVS